MLRVEKIKILNGKEISFELARGELLHLEGPNGSGKSLLLKSLSKLIPASWEQYEFEGEKIESLKIEDLRAKLLYLPPNVVFDNELTVDEFLDEPLALAQYADFKKTFEPRDFLGDLSKKMGLLSSGQKQGVALLRAMSLKAQILFLDEPFGHIDQSKRKMYIDLLGQWAGSQKSIIIVSHDPVTFSKLTSKKLALD
jgi:ABC-type multidrug transport system ATPase subunit